MPALEEEPATELSSSDSPALYALLSLSSSEFSGSSESERDQLSPIDSPYSKFDIPQQDPTLRDILVNTTKTEDLTTICKLKLQVLASEVSISHLSFLTPNLSELTLDGSCLLSLRDLGCDLKNLKILHVARCGLTSVDGVFGLETLHELYASNNKIEDPSPCSFLPNIRLLDFKGNLIKNFDCIAFLACCTYLEHLFLADNEGLVDKKYRQNIKNLLPNLKSLDSVRFDENISPEIHCGESSVAGLSNDNSSEQNQLFLPTIASRSRTSESNGRGPLTPETRQFTVSFPPKVLSPRPSSPSFNFTSTLSSASNSTSSSSSPKGCVLPNINKKSF